MKITDINVVPIEDPEDPRKEDLAHVEIVLDDMLRLHGMKLRKTGFDGRMYLSYPTNPTAPRIYSWSERTIFEPINSSFRRYLEDAAIEEYKEIVGGDEDLEESRQRRGCILNEEVKFIPEEEISRTEIKRMKDGGEIIKRVEGGWVWFDTWSDYETWKNQR